MADVDVADIEVADIEFYWDPICPFAWVTSRWVEKVVAQRPMTVDWRFISLRILNEGRDYETEFPPNYLDMHTRGVRMLRVAAAAREAHGRELVGPLYTALGESIWNRTRQPGVQAFAGIGDAEHLSAVLAVVGLPAALAAAADDAGFDAILRADTEAGLERTGGGVGTPIVVYGGPAGPGFFGPVISRVPDAADALRLWDAVTLLAEWPGFAEIKRSARELPQLPLLAPKG
jgi:2-hydroxychromene-2-carboxylate isomerase